MVTSGSGDSVNPGDVALDFGPGNVLAAVVSCHATGWSPANYPFCGIQVDGADCAFDRGYADTGSNAYASANCTRFLTGTHTVRIVHSGVSSTWWRYEVFR